MAQHPPLQYQLHIRKEALKFASAHMTVFPDGTKEALHGHNYVAQLNVRVAGISLKEMVSFAVFKAALKVVCDHWDEKVLIAKDCPFLEIHSAGATEIDFTLCGKHYVLPTDEVEMLPVDNITTECLSAEIFRRIYEVLQKEPKFAAVVGLEVRVEESPGQGASTLWERS